VKLDKTNVSKIFNRKVLSNKNKSIWQYSREGIIRGITAANRTVPSFIIIGEQKCGTSSLYTYLVRHPNILAPLRKEIHFFDNDYHFGLNMYKANFPTIKEIEQISKNNGICITGEASPNYLSNPSVPKRVRETLPNVKLVVILRNPVKRAYSHYQMTKRDGFETLSFEDAIQYEKKCIDEGKISWSRQHRIFNETHFPYLMRGLYADNLKRWFELFPKNQILILKNEDLKKNTTETLLNIHEFLGLPPCKIRNLKERNVGTYEPMNPKTEKFLNEFFKPHNEKLSQILNKDLGW
jgi:hypothetical protein